MGPGEMLRKYTDRFFDNCNQVFQVEDCNIIDNYLSGLYNWVTWRAMFQARPSST